MEARGSSTPVITAPETWRKRENLWPGLILLVLTLTAWVYTIDQAQAMGGMVMEGMNKAPNLTLFLFGWAAMMVAMMLPAALPLILLYRVVASKRLSHTSALATWRHCWPATSRSRPSPPCRSTPIPLLPRPRA